MVRLIVSTIFCLHFLTAIVIHARSMHSSPNEAVCVARDDINHPITVTELTDLEAVKDVGLLFFRVCITGFCIMLLS